jgi:hypothetical protein
MPIGNHGPKVPDWCQIAERAAQESDPKKLIQLVRALCDRLQEAENRKRKQPQSETATRGNGAIAKPPAG